MPRYRSSIADLLLQRGDIAAQAAQAKGNIWGGALQNFGGIAQNYLAEREAKKQQQAEQQAAIEEQQRQVEAQQQQAAAEEEKRAARMGAFTSASQQYDPNNPLGFVQNLGSSGLFDVGETLDFTKKMGDYAKVAQTAADPKREDYEAGLNTILAARDSFGDEYLTENWENIKRDFAPGWQKFGGGVPFPEQYSPEAGDFLKRLLAPENAPTGYKNEFELYSKGSPEEVKAYQDRQATEAARVAAAREGAAPKPALSPTQESNIITRLTTQWDKATQPVRDIERQANLMNAGIEAARRGDMAAGSQAVLVTFQKILDPTSVVRESEYARSASGQSAMARARGIVDKLTKGGAGVPLPELEKFSRLADDMIRASSGSYIGNLRERVGKTADRYGIPRDVIFTEEGYGLSGGGTDEEPPE